MERLSNSNKSHTFRRQTRTGTCKIQIHKVSEQSMYLQNCLTCWRLNWLADQFISYIRKIVKIIKYI